nr:uncharacterized protein LOC113805115 [Penaeus vannamei]
MPCPRTLAAAAAVLLFLAGPSPACAGFFRNVILTETQEETVRKVDGLLNQFLENIRRMYYKKYPPLKSHPHEGFAFKDYSVEAFTIQDLNPGTSSPVEIPLHTNICKEQEGNDAQRGMDPGRDTQEPPIVVDEKGGDRADGKEGPPVAFDEKKHGQDFSGNAMGAALEYDGSRIWFPDN